MNSEPANSSAQSIGDRLALERTRLANERTALAYARTAIMLAATGTTLLELYGDQWLIIGAGVLLIAVAVGTAAAGAARFRRLARSLV